MRSLQTVHVPVASIKSHPLRPGTGATSSTSMGSTPSNLRHELDHDCLADGVAACLTLGFIELGIGLAQPPRAARLLFAVSAFTVACIAGLELALMRTDVLAEWWPLMRLLDIAVGHHPVVDGVRLGVFRHRAKVARARGPGPVRHRVGVRLSARGAARLGMTYQRFIGSERSRRSVAPPSTWPRVCQTRGMCSRTSRSWR